MSAYYNEFDPDAAAWLRELIVDGLIAPGDVDERSIVDVSADDVKGYGQCHWFAGIGGWSYALRLAGWPDDRPVWTASLPCQPFSTAGKRLGKEDERHLLPHFIGLVTQCRPSILFGEQVGAAIKHGWLDDLYTEMEANNYAVGSVVIGAHSIGAAHIRQRLYWVADAIGNDNQRTVGRFNGEANRSEISNRTNVAESGQSSGAGANVCGLHDPESERWCILNTEDVRSADGKIHAFANSGEGFDGLSNTSSERRGETRSDSSGYQERFAGGSDWEWLYCRDDKYRPIESRVKPLVDGVPSGMGYGSDPRNTQEAWKMRLKGYGNAIQVQTARSFIRAFMESEL